MMNFPFCYSLLFDFSYICLLAINNDIAEFRVEISYFLMSDEVRIQKEKHVVGRH